MRAKIFAGGAAATLLLSLGPSPAHAEFNLELGGRIQSNVRFRVDDIEAGNFYDRRRFEKGVARNEHILKVKAAATAADRFSAIIDMDFVWLNLQRDVATLDDLSLRENVESTRFEAHSAYIEALDLFVDGLDLRLGQQIVSWGVGDGFNPTNNLNADDVEDRLLYGIQQANLMGRLSYSVGDSFSVEAIGVPVFRPALLPTSGVIALALVDRLPMLDANIRHRLAAENTFSASPDIGQPTRVSEIIVETPETSFENMQFGFRLATTIFEQDIALSYYQGFEDFPVPIRNDTVPNDTTVCDPDDETNCVDRTLDTTTTLAYPRIKVIGLNLSGEFDALSWISDVFNPIGYRIEVGFYIPEERRIRLFQDNVVVGTITVDGEYDYNGFSNPGLGEAPLVVDSTPYAKWVVGLDYTFGPHVYLNVQWVHGLADEVGAGDWITEGYTVRQSSSTPNAFINNGIEQEATVADCATFENIGLGAPPEVCAREILRPRIGDYIVLGLDFMFDSSRGLFRLFTIVDVTTMIEEVWSPTRGRRIRNNLSPFSKEGYSITLFPELNYNFGSGFEVAVGGLVLLGRDYTKFGDPAAGGSIVWTRARFSF